MRENHDMENERHPPQVVERPTGKPALNSTAVSRHGEGKKNRRAGGAMLRPPRRDKAKRMCVRSGEQARQEFYSMNEYVVDSERPSRLRES